MKGGKAKVAIIEKGIAKWLSKRDNGGRDCWENESRDNQNIYKKEARQILSLIK